MTVRVAIMGFGRMGRSVFRACYPRTDMQVVAINDIADPKAMEYLLRHDSLSGPFPEPVSIIDDFLYVQGRRIPVLHQKEPGEVPWFEYGVDVVVEATGRYRTAAQLRRHLEAGADRVVLTTPPRDEIDVVYVPGMNREPIARSHRLISCGSSTANCLVLMLKLLDENFGVQSGFFTSVHAYTSEQSLIDTFHGDFRLSRAAVENIVPVSTWSVHMVDRLFPHLAGKFGGGKLNVPVSDVSCVDLVTVHDQEVSASEVNEVFRSAARSTLKGLVHFTEEPIVSSDVSGSPASCTFDSLTTMVVENSMVKTLGWYDQGGGLAARIVDVLAQLAPRGEGVRS
ncbi:MAG: type I glyceraldehyde-3-phosphate dehydrogenase [Planctomycetota bacterium]